MGAWLTWRQIPVPEWLRPVVEWAHRPPLSPPQPGTYGNAAVARAAQTVAALPHYGSSFSSPSRPGESDHGAPPWREQYPRYPSSSSASIGTQPRLQSTAGATGALEPSRADPLSPWQERAAQRRARRYPSAPQHHPGSTSAPPQGATSGDRGNPARPIEGENLRPEEPSSAANPQPADAPSHTRRQTLSDPVPTRERHHPLTPPRTGPETGSHHDSPAQSKTAETPINHPATGPASALASAHAPHADAPMRAQLHGPHPATPQAQGPTLAQIPRGAHRHATTAQPTAPLTADRTQAVTSTADRTPPGAHVPEVQPEARAPGDTVCAAHATDQRKTGRSHGEH